MVARYKVVDSPKGREAGEELALRIALHFSGGQFPTALVGERFLVTAFREAPESMIATSMTGPVPLWWRQIPADFSTPLLQGVVQIPPPWGGREFLGSTGSSHESIEAFWEAALKLLALPPEQQEERLLRAQAEKYLFDDRWEQKLPDDSPFRGELAEAEGAGELVTILLNVSREQEDGPSYPAYKALWRGGREIALHMLEKVEAKSSPLGEEEHRELLQSLFRKVGLIDEPEESYEWELPTSTEEETAELRRLLKERAPYHEAGDGILLLTEHDPEAVAEYLLEWESPRERWYDEHAGYFLGSFFAWRVKEDRSKHLRSLLHARDPYIRVAGAVYLCFEDKDEGMRLLRELVELDGFPGVWAALTLARRGDKSAVEPMIEVFKLKTGPGEGDYNQYDNFDGRVRVLLSNSAAASGVPQPDPPFPVWHEKEEYEQIHDYYAKWWEGYGEKVALHDPWLPVLEEQKVD